MNFKCHQIARLANVVSKHNNWTLLEVTLSISAYIEYTLNGFAFQLNHVWSQHSGMRATFDSGYQMRFSFLIFFATTTNRDDCSRIFTNTGTMYALHSEKRFPLWNRLVLPFWLFCPTRANLISFVVFIMNNDVTWSSHVGELNNICCSVANNRMAWATYQLQSIQTF